jgi:hypothetical protein
MELHHLYWAVGGFVLGVTVARLNDIVEFFTFEGIKHVNERW